MFSIVTDTVSTPLALCAIFLGSVYLLHAYLLSKSPRVSKEHKLPPCPVMRWPIVGTLPSMKENPRDQFKAWHQLCGDVFSLYFGSTLVVVISGYKMIKEALVTKGAAFTDRPPMLANEVLRMSDAGLAFSCGSVWREHRAVTTVILKELGLSNQTMVRKVQTEARCLVEQLFALNGRATDIQHLIHVAVSNVICSVIVGKRFEPDDQQFQQIMQSLMDLASGAKGAAIVNFFPWLRHLPGDFFKTRMMERAIVDINALFARICAVPEDGSEECKGRHVREAWEKTNATRNDDTKPFHHVREKSRKGHGEEEAAEGLSVVEGQKQQASPEVADQLLPEDTVPSADCFTSSYREKRLEKLGMKQLTHMDERNLLKTILDLFAAGTESTASTISWCLVFTLRNNDVQKRLHAELDSTLGRDSVPTLSDRTRLPYLEAVIKETQRLASIVPFSLMRMTTQEVKLSDHVIPKGTSVLTNLDSVLHDPAIWGADVAIFNPSRFLNSDGSLRRGPDEFIPFSLGKRACIGEGLARTELFLFLAAMFQRFVFRLPETSNPPSLEGIVGLTVVPQPYSVCCIDRWANRGRPRES